MSYGNVFNYFRGQMSKIPALLKGVMKRNFLFSIINEKKFIKNVLFRRFTLYNKISISATSAQNSMLSTFQAGVKYFKCDLFELNAKPFWDYFFIFFLTSWEVVWTQKIQNSRGTCRRYFVPPVKSETASWWPARTSGE